MMSNNGNNQYRWYAVSFVGNQLGFSSEYKVKVTGDAIRLVSNITPLTLNYSDTCCLSNFKTNDVAGLESTEITCYMLTIIAGSILSLPRLMGVERSLICDLL